MSTIQVNGHEDTRLTILRACAATLERVASYRLPRALDQRLLWLSENKEGLTPAEREELLGLVEFSQDRTIEKLQARALVQQLAEVWPEVVTSTP
jgi:hypothetical protein